MFTAVKNITLCLLLLTVVLTQLVNAQGRIRPTAYDPPPGPTVSNPTAAEEIEGESINSLGENFGGVTGEEKYFYENLIPPITSSAHWLKSGLWYFNGEAVMMHRSGAQKVELSAQARTSIITGLPVVISNGQLIGGLPAAHNVALSTDSRRFGYEPGMRMTLGRFLGRDEKNRDYSVEFTYFGLFEWEANGGAMRGNDVAGFPLFLVTLLDDYTSGFTPTPTSGFTGAETQSFSYRSDFSSYEFNLRVENRLGHDQLVLTDGRWKHELTPGFTWGFLGGIRGFNIDERFEFVSLGADPNQIAGNYSVKTHNDLIGFQFGADIREQKKKWSYGGQVKVGGLLNFADQDSEVFQLDTQGVLAPLANSTTAFSADDNQLSLMVEAKAFANYQIQPNLVIELSYNFMWLNGLALAPEQLTSNFSQGPQITTGGYHFYDGLAIGLTWYR